MNPTNRIPWVTLLLIGLNLVPAFVLLFDPLWVDRLGFRAEVPSVGTALSSLFLHQNVLHLLGNLLFLAAVGPAVEMGAGWYRFLIVYVVGGLAGCLAHWLLMRHMEGAPPLIGASGAIASCIGYACIRFFHVRVPLTPKWSVPVFSVALIWLCLQVVGAFIRLGDPLGGVAFWAHIGGFVAGVLMSLAFKAPTTAETQLAHESIERMGDRSPAALKVAAEQRLKVQPDDTRAMRQKAEACKRLGETQEEHSTIIDLLELVPESEQESLYARLADLGALGDVASSRRLVLAERFKPTNLELARTLLTSVVDGPESDAQRPEAMLSLATLNLGNHDDDARRLLDELGSIYPMHPATEVARAKGLLP